MRGAVTNDAVIGSQAIKKTSPESHEITRIRVVEMVVVPMQNGGKSCTAITSGSPESLGNMQNQA